MLGLWWLSFMSVVWACTLLNISFEGDTGMWVTLLLSIPVMAIYLFFYRQHYFKLIEKYNQSKGQ